MTKKTQNKTQGTVTLSIRTESALKAALQEKADKEGESLNKIVTGILWAGIDIDDPIEIKIKNIIKQEMKVVRREGKKIAEEVLKDLLKKYDLIQQTKIQ